MSRIHCHTFRWRASIASVAVSLLSACFDTNVQPCEVTQHEDGSATIDCGEEGGVATIPAGAPGQDGVDANADTPATVEVEGDQASGLTSSAIEPGEECLGGGVYVAPVDAPENGVAVCFPDCPAGFSIDATNSKCALNTTCQVQSDCTADKECIENRCVDLCPPGQTRERGVCVAATLVVPSVGLTHACARFDNNRVTCWGKNDTGQVSKTPEASRFEQVSAGFGFSCGVEVGGALRCWGRDVRGEVSGAPQTRGWRAVDAGKDSACALNMVGEITCWGDTDDVKVNAAPASLGFAEVSLGWSAACAIHSGGALMCWGSDADGIISDAPTRAGFEHVDVGVDSACAVHSDGTLECWGRGHDSASMPTGSDFVAVGVERASCALRDGGGLTCWGASDALIADAPMAVGQGARLSMGSDVACAVAASGQLTCWGVDVSGIIASAP